MKLTDEQITLLKQLWLDGHSSRYIFQQIGGSLHNTTQRIAYYRRKLKLPPRPRGFKSTDYREWQRELQREKARKRLDHIFTHLVPTLMKRLDGYYEEAQRLYAQLD